MDHINPDWLKKDGRYECPLCPKTFCKKGISTHVWRTHGEGKKHDTKMKGRIPWNRGYTKENNDVIRKTAERLKERYGKGEIFPSRIGIRRTEAEKLYLSEIMKKRHKEGRAWNIGWNRWRREPSWPEKFFASVIENEFDDKNCVKEHIVGTFSLDFAWVEKKKVIEIDGEQHLKDDYQRRDKRKDAFLIGEGWQIMRIPFKSFYKDTKVWIYNANRFVGK